jgi:hypothetical protein
MDADLAVQLRRLGPVKFGHEAGGRSAPANSVACSTSLGN